MSIEILKPALSTILVADRREGARSFGIGPGGAMDYFAMKTANYLVGNDLEAVLEISQSSLEVLIKSECTLAVTGKGFEGLINELSFPLWKTIRIKKDSILKLKKTSGGAFAYIAVHSGWRAENWLGSFTTNVNAKAGGYHGSILKKNDIVEINRAHSFIGEPMILPWGISLNEVNEIYSSQRIRCITAPETDWLAVNSKEKFVLEEFTISNQSNRMGYRLQGVTLVLAKQTEMISSPVDFGTLQLLPDGNLIALMADHQTTGGYPRIASVIKADLPRLAQVMPNEKIKFTLVSLIQAESELLSTEQKLKELKKSCHEKFYQHLAL